LHPIYKRYISFENILLFEKKILFITLGTKAVDVVKGKKNKEVDNKSKKPSKQ
jgi:hypothetical protein